MAEAPQQVTIMSILFPVCHHQAERRLFAHRVQTVHQRIANGVVRELDILDQEEPEQEVEGPEAIPEEAGHQQLIPEDEGRPDGIERDLTPQRVEDGSVHSDGCVTAAGEDPGEDPDESPRSEGASGASPRENDHGIPHSSSPPSRVVIIQPRAGFAHAGRPRFYVY